MKIIRDFKYRLAKKIVANYEEENRHKTPSFWYMRDDHTFIKPDGQTTNEIKEQLILIAKENPYGVVCSVTILEDGKSESEVGQHCHVDKDGNVNLDKWYEDIMKEDCVRNYKK